MKTLYIVLSSIATSALLYYVTSSMVLAQKQLVAANRLQAYLKHWSQWVLDNDYFPIFNIGREWSEEEFNMITSGKGPEELVKLRVEKKELVKKIREKAAETEEFKLNREAMQNFVRRLPKEAANFYLEEGKTRAQNLLLGHTFITDEEAATLGISIIQEAVELKMQMVDITEKVYLLAASVLSGPDTLTDEDGRKALGELLWPCVLAARSHTTLLRCAQLFTTRTVTELTLRNIRKGSRFTKR